MPGPTIQEMLVLSKANVEARETYTKAMRKYLSDFAPMSDEQFWPMAEKLKASIERFVVGYKREVKSGVSEFVRAHLFDGRRSECPTCSQGVPVTSNEVDRWHEVAAFARQYEVVTTKLYHHMKKWDDLDRGDDGFGDLCDSLPLAGKGVFDGIANKDIIGVKQLEKAVGAVMTGEKSLSAKFVLYGENYIRMMLEESLTKFFNSLQNYL